MANPILDFFQRIKRSRRQKQYTQVANRFDDDEKVIPADTGEAISAEKEGTKPTLDTLVPNQQELLQQQLGAWLDSTGGRFGGRPSIFKNTGLDAKIRVLESAFKANSIEAIGQAVLDLKYCMEDMDRKIAAEKIDLDEKQPGRQIAFNELKDVVDAAAKDVSLHVKRPVALLDVDNTIILPGVGNKINMPLAEALKKQGIRDIYLFTNMSADNVPDRARLIGELRDLGFNVLGAISPGDLLYKYFFSGTPEEKAEKSKILQEIIATVNEPPVKGNTEYPGGITNRTPQGVENFNKLLKAKIGENWLEIVKQSRDIGSFFEECPEGGKLLGNAPPAANIFTAMCDVWAQLSGHKDPKGAMFEMLCDSSKKPVFASSFIMFDDSPEPRDAVKAASDKTREVVTIVPVTTTTGKEKKPDTQGYYEEKIKAHKLVGTVEGVQQFFADSEHKAARISFSGETLTRLQKEQQEQQRLGQPQQQPTEARDFFSWAPAGGSTTDISPTVALSPMIVSAPATTMTPTTPKLQRVKATEMKIAEGEVKKVTIEPGIDRDTKVAELTTLPKSMPEPEPEIFEHQWPDKQQTQTSVTAISPPPAQPPMQAYVPPVPAMTAPVFTAPVAAVPVPTAVSAAIPPVPKFPPLPKEPPSQKLTLSPDAASASYDGKLAKLCMSLGDDESQAKDRVQKIIQAVIDKTAAGDSLAKDLVDAMLHSTDEKSFVKVFAGMAENVARATNEVADVHGGFVAAVNYKDAAIAFMVATVAYKDAGDNAGAVAAYKEAAESFKSAMDASNKETDDKSVKAVLLELSKSLDALAPLLTVPSAAIPLPPLQPPMQAYVSPLPTEPALTFTGSSAAAPVPTSITAAVNAAAKVTAVAVPVTPLGVAVAAPKPIVASKKLEVLLKERGELLEYFKGLKPSSPLTARDLRQMGKLQEQFRSERNTLWPQIEELDKKLKQSPPSKSKQLSNLLQKTRDLYDLLQKLQELTTAPVLAITAVPLATVTMSREALKDTKHPLFYMDEASAVPILPLTALAARGLEYHFAIGDMAEKLAGTILVCSAEKGDKSKIYRDDVSHKYYVLRDISNENFLAQIVRDLVGVTVVVDGTEVTKLADLARVAGFSDEVIKEIAEKAEDFGAISVCLKSAQSMGKLSSAQIRKFGMLCVAIHQGEINGSIYTASAFNAEKVGAKMEDSSALKHVTITSTMESLKIEYVADCKKMAMIDREEGLSSSQPGGPVMSFGGIFDFTFPSDAQNATADLSNVSSTIKVYSRELFENKNTAPAFSALLTERSTSKFVVSPSPANVDVKVVEQRPSSSSAVSKPKLELEDRTTPQLQQRFVAYVRAALMVLVPNVYEQNGTEGPYVKELLNHVNQLKKMHHGDREFKTAFDGFIGFIKTAKKNEAQYIDYIRDLLLPPPTIASEADFQFALLDLANSLRPITGASESETFKMLNLAEGFCSAWRLGTTSICTVTQIDGDKAIVERDTPIPGTYTDAQVAEYCKIFGAKQEQPQWFTDLPLFARNHLLNVLQPVNDAFVKGNLAAARQALGEAIGVLPATMRMLPGAANHTRHDVYVVNRKDGQILSETHAIRAATLMPGQVKNPAERQRIAEQNLEQLAKEHLEGLANRLYADLVALVQARHPRESLNSEDVQWITKQIEKRLPLVPIAVESLVSPLGRLGSLFDTIHSDKMVAAIKDAIAALQKQGVRIELANGTSLSIKPAFLFFNFPINKLRTNPLLASEHEVNMRSLSQLVRYVEDYLRGKYFIDDKIKLEDLLNVKRIPDLPEYKNDKMLVSALSALIDLCANGKIKEVSQDENLLRSALALIATQGAGGIGIIGCKSAKDRCGVVFAYQTAILRYFAKYGEMPKPATIAVLREEALEGKVPFVQREEVAKRQDFVAMVADALLAGHAQRVAELNAEGVEALKELGGALPKDVRGKLIEADPDFFDYNKQVSEQNKPYLPGMLARLRASQPAEEPVEQAVTVLPSQVPSQKQRSMPVSTTTTATMTGPIAPQRQEPLSAAATTTTASVIPQQPISSATTVATPATAAVTTVSISQPLPPPKHPIPNLSELARGGKELVGKVVNAKAEIEDYIQQHPDLAGDKKTGLQERIEEYNGFIGTHLAFYRQQVQELFQGQDYFGVIEFLKNFQANKGYELKISGGDVFLPLFMEIFSNVLPDDLARFEKAISQYSTMLSLFKLLGGELGYACADAQAICAYILKKRPASSEGAAVPATPSPDITIPPKLIEILFTDSDNKPLPTAKHEKQLGEYVAAIREFIQTETEKAAPSPSAVVSFDVQVAEALLKTLKDSQEKLANEFLKTWIEKSALSFHVRPDVFKDKKNGLDAKVAAFAANPNGHHSDQLLLDLYIKILSICQPEGYGKLGDYKAKFDELKACVENILQTRKLSTMSAQELDTYLSKSEVKSVLDQLGPKFNEFSIIYNAIPEGVRGVVWTQLVAESYASTGSNNTFLRSNDFVTRLVTMCISEAFGEDIKRKVTDIQKRLDNTDEAVLAQEWKDFICNHEAYKQNVSLLFNAIKTKYPRAKEAEIKQLVERAIFLRLSAKLCDVENKSLLKASLVMQKANALIQQTTDNKQQIEDRQSKRRRRRFNPEDLKKQMEELVQVLDIGEQEKAELLRQLISASEQPAVSVALAAAPTTLAQKPLKLTKQQKELLEQRKELLRYFNTLDIRIPPVLESKLQMEKLQKQFQSERNELMRQIQEHPSRPLWEMYDLTLKLLQKLRVLLTPVSDKVLAAMSKKASTASVTAPVPVAALAAVPTLSPTVSMPRAAQYEKIENTILLGIVSEVVKSGKEVKFIGTAQGGQLQNVADVVEEINKLLAGKIQQETVKRVVELLGQINIDLRDVVTLEEITTLLQGDDCSDRIYVYADSGLEKALEKVSQQLKDPGVLFTVKLAVYEEFVKTFHSIYNEQKEKLKEADILLGKLGNIEKKSRAVMAAAEGEISALNAAIYNLGEGGGIAKLTGKIMLFDTSSLSKEFADFIKQFNDVYTKFEAITRGAAKDITALKAVANELLDKEIYKSMPTAFEKLKKLNVDFSGFDADDHMQKYGRMFNGVFAALEQRSQQLKDSTVEADKLEKTEIDKILTRLGQKWNDVTPLPLPQGEEAAVPPAPLAAPITAPPSLEEISKVLSEALEASKKLLPDEPMPGGRSRNFPNNMTVLQGGNNTIISNGKIECRINNDFDGKNVGSIKYKVKGDSGWHFITDENDLLKVLEDIPQFLQEIENISEVLKAEAAKVNIVSQPLSAPTSAVLAVASVPAVAALTPTAPAVSVALAAAPALSPTVLQPSSMPTAVPAALQPSVPAPVVTTTISENDRLLQLVTNEHIREVLRIVNVDFLPGIGAEKIREFDDAMRELPSGTSGKKIGEMLGEILQFGDDEYLQNQLGFEVKQAVLRGELRQELLVQILKGFTLKSQGLVAKSTQELIKDFVDEFGKKDVNKDNVDEVIRFLKGVVAKEELIQKIGNDDVLRQFILEFSQALKTSNEVGAAISEGRVLDKKMVSDIELRIITLGSFSEKFTKAAAETTTVKLGDKLEDRKSKSKSRVLEPVSEVINPAEKLKVEIEKQLARAQEAYVYKLAEIETFYRRIVIKEELQDIGKVGVIKVADMAADMQETQRHVDKLDEMLEKGVFDKDPANAEKARQLLGQGKQRMVIMKELISEWVKSPDNQKKILASVEDIKKKYLDGSVDAADMAKDREDVEGLLDLLKNSGADPSFTGQIKELQKLIKNAQHADQAIKEFLDTENRFIQSFYTKFVATYTEVYKGFITQHPEAAEFLRSFDAFIKSMGVDPSVKLGIEKFSSLSLKEKISLLSNLKVHISGMMDRFKQYVPFYQMQSGFIGAGLFKIRTQSNDLVFIDPTKLERSELAFFQELDKALRGEGGGGQGVLDFLIMPVQRPMRYAMQLTDIVEHLPEVKEKGEVKKMLISLVEPRTKEINEANRDYAVGKWTNILGKDEEVDFIRLMVAIQFPLPLTRDGELVDDGEQCANIRKLLSQDKISAILSKEIFKQLSAISPVAYGEHNESTVVTVLNNIKDGIELLKILGGANMDIVSELCKDHRLSMLTREISKLVNGDIDKIKAGIVWLKLFHGKNMDMVYELCIHPELTELATSIIKSPNTSETSQRDEIINLLSQVEINSKTADKVADAVCEKLKEFDIPITEQQRTIIIQCVNNVKAKIVEKEEKARAVQQAAASMTAAIPGAPTNTAVSTAPRLASSIDVVKAAAKQLNFKAVIENAVALSQLRTQKSVKNEFAQEYTGMIRDLASVLREEMVRLYKAVPTKEWLDIKSYTAEEVKKHTPNKQALVDHVQTVLQNWIKNSLLEQPNPQMQAYTMVFMIELAEYSLYTLHDSASYVAIMSVLATCKQKGSPFNAATELLPETAKDKLSEAVKVMEGNFKVLSDLATKHDDFILPPSIYMGRLTAAGENPERGRNSVDGSIEMQADGTPYNPRAVIGNKVLEPLSSLLVYDSKVPANKAMLSKIKEVAEKQPVAAVTTSPSEEPLKEEVTSLLTLKTEAPKEEVPSAAAKTVTQKEGLRYCAKIANPILAVIVRQLVMQGQEIKLMPSPEGQSTLGGKSTSVDGVIVEINKLLAAGRKIDEDCVKKLTAQLQQIGIKLESQGISRTTDEIISLLDGDSHRKIFAYASSTGEALDPDLNSHMRLFADPEGSFMKRLAVCEDFSKEKNQFLNGCDGKIAELNKRLKENDELIAKLSEFIDKHPKHTFKKIFEEVKADLEKMKQNKVIDGAIEGIEGLRGKISKITEQQILKNGFGDLVREFGEIEKGCNEIEKSNPKAVIDLASRLQRGTYELMPSFFARLDRLGIKVADFSEKGHKAKYETTLRAVIGKLELLEKSSDVSEEDKKTIKETKEKLQEKLSIVSKDKELQEIEQNAKELSSATNDCIKQGEKLSTKSLTAFADLSEKFAKLSKEILQLVDACDKEKELASKEQPGGDRELSARSKREVLENLLKSKNRIAEQLAQVNRWKQILASEELVDKELKNSKQQFLNDSNDRKYLDNFEKLFGTSDGLQMLSEILKDKDRYKAYCELYQGSGADVSKNPLFKALGIEKLDSSFVDNQAITRVTKHFDLLAKIKNPQIRKVILDNNFQFAAGVNEARIEQFNEAMQELPSAKEVGEMLAEVFELGDDEEQHAKLGSEVKQAVLRGGLSGLFKFIFEGFTLKAKEGTQTFMEDFVKKYHNLDTDNVFEVIAHLKKVIQPPGVFGAVKDSIEYGKLCIVLLSLPAVLSKFNEIKEAVSREEVLDKQMIAAVETNIQLLRSVYEKLKTPTEDTKTTKRKSGIPETPTKETKTTKRKSGMPEPEAIPGVDKLLKEMEALSVAQVTRSQEFYAAQLTKVKEFYVQVDPRFRGITDKPVKGVSIDDVRGIVADMKEMQHYVDILKDGVFVADQEKEAKQLLEQGQQGVGTRKEFISYWVDKHRAEISKFIDDTKTYRSGEANVANIERDVVAVAEWVDLLKDSGDEVLIKQMGELQKLIKGAKHINYAINEFLETEKSFRELFFTQFVATYNDVIGKHPEATAFLSDFTRFINCMGVAPEFVVPDKFSSLSIKDKVSWLLGLQESKYIESMMAKFKQYIPDLNEQKDFVRNIQLGEAKTVEEKAAQQCIRKIDEKLKGPTRGQEIKGLMTLPMQRGLKYPLLLDEVLKEFPGEWESKKSVQEMRRLVNEKNVETNTATPQMAPVAVQQSVQKPQTPVAASVVAATAPVTPPPPTVSVAGAVAEAARPGLAVVSQPQPKEEAGSIVEGLKRTLTRFGNAISSALGFGKSSDKYVVSETRVAAVSPVLAQQPVQPSLVTTLPTPVTTTAVPPTVSLDEELKQKAIAETKAKVEKQLAEQQRQQQLAEQQRQQQLAEEQQKQRLEALDRAAQAETIAAVKARFAATAQPATAVAPTTTVVTETPTAKEPVVKTKTDEAEELLRNLAALKAEFPQRGKKPTTVTDAQGSGLPLVMTMHPKKDEELDALLKELTEGGATATSNVSQQTAIRSSSAADILRAFGPSSDITEADFKQGLIQGLIIEKKFSEDKAKEVVEKIKQVIEDKSLPDPDDKAKEITKLLTGEQAPTEKQVFVTGLANKISGIMQRDGGLMIPAAIVGFILGGPFGAAAGAAAVGVGAAMLGQGPRPLPTPPLKMRQTGSGTSPASALVEQKKNGAVVGEGKLGSNKLDFGMFGKISRVPPNLPPENLPHPPPSGFSAA